MGKKIMKHLFTLIALIAVGGAAFFGWKIIETELRNRREQEDINEIYEMMQAVTAPDSQNTETKAQSSGTRSDSLEESAEAGKSETKEEPIVVRTPEELLAELPDDGARFYAHRRLCDRQECPYRHPHGF